jgi:hypothetical protein
MVSFPQASPPTPCAHLSPLGCYLSYSKKVMQMSYFGLQICITSNKYIVHCMSKLCWGYWRHHNLNESFHTIFTVRFITIHFNPLTFHSRKNCTGSDLLKVEATIPCLLICNLKHVANSAYNCFHLCELLHCLPGGGGETHRLPRHW